MDDIGFTVKGSSGSRRVELKCEHQGGVLYAVPSEASWVCPEETIHIHAIAGFFSQLVELKNPIVTDLMQKWGLYFREQSSFNE